MRAHRPAVEAVGQHHRRRPVAPFLAPLAKRQHHRQQRLALVGQRVDHLALVGRIGRPLEDPAGDELAEPVGEDVAGNPEPGLEFLEMLEAVERAAQDQERPFLADQLDRAGQRAVQRRLAERIDVRCHLLVRQPLSSL